MDIGVRIGIARRQEREILLLARGAYDDGEDRPRLHEYATSGESDKHIDLIRMTEAVCGRIRSWKNTLIETRVRKAVRDDLKKVALELAPGIRRVEALRKALVPYHLEIFSYRGIPEIYAANRGGDETTPPAGVNSAT